MSDNAAMTALIRKKGLSILLDENVESARSFVRQFGLATGLLDTVAFSVDPAATDRQIADVVFLTKATVEEVMLDVKEGCSSCLIKREGSRTGTMDFTCS
jgi:hypothetical protein